jgi:hypothetical protein
MCRDPPRECSASDKFLTVRFWTTRSLQSVFGLQDFSQSVFGLQEFSQSVFGYARVSQSVFSHARKNRNFRNP